MIEEWPARVNAYWNAFKRLKSDVAQSAARVAKCSPRIWIGAPGAVEKGLNHE